MTTPQRSIFTTLDECRQSPDQSTAPAGTEPLQKTDYAALGWQRAQQSGGKLQSFKINLHRLGLLLRDEALADFRLQVENKTMLRTKMSALQQRNEAIAEEVNQLRFIKRENTFRRINNMYDKITAVRNRSALQSMNRTGFLFSTVLLLALTVYLLVHYSTIGYAAFFQNIGIDGTPMLPVIMNGHVFLYAWQDNIQTLFTIGCIPLFILCSGVFTRMVMRKNKKRGKRIAAVLLVSVAMFHLLLAFTILQKLRAAEALSSLTDPLPYHLKEAVSDPDFWLIFSAGFPVFLACFFVFHFWAESVEKKRYARKRIALEEQGIAEAGKEIKHYDAEIKALQFEAAINQSRISRIEKQLSHVSISYEAAEKNTYAFLAGWQQWMERQKMPREEIDLTQRIAAEFLTQFKADE